MKRIGVILSEIEAAYQAKLLKGTISKATELGYDVLIFSTFIKITHLKDFEYGERVIYNMINFDLLDGVIVLGDTLKMEGLFDEIVDTLKEKCKCPVVFIDSDADGFESVYVEDTLPFERVVDHVIEVHNCKDIMFLSGALEVPSTRLRLQGYINSFKNHNLPINDDLICFDGEFWYSGGKKVAKEIVAGKRSMPEAILCCGDAMAIGISQVFKENGIRIPEDVIVIGFDATDESIRVKPPLTSYSPPVFEAGQNAVIAIKCLQNGEKPHGFVLGSGKLEVGASCGCQEDFEYTKRDYKLRRLDEDYLEFVNSNMMETLSRSDSVDALMGTIQYFLYLIKGWNDFYLCMCDDWMGNNKNYGDDFILDNYTNRMQVTIESENKQNRTTNDWMSIKQMLPDLYNERDETKVYYFNPIHFNERCFGYAILSFEDKMTTFDINYRNWCKHINNSLETIRIQTALHNMAERDTLTGVYTRQGQENNMEIIEKRLRNNDNKVFVLVADLDKLKWINDENGHKSGDIAIKAVAEALSSSSVSNQLCVRTGGDEFAVFGCGNYGDNYINEFYQKVNDRIQEFNGSKILDFDISVSMGAVCKQINNISKLKDLYDLADKLMYKNKRRKYSKLC